MMTMRVQRPLAGSKGDETARKRSPPASVKEQHACSKPILQLRSVSLLGEQGAAHSWWLMTEMRARFKGPRRCWTRPGRDRTELRSRLAFYASIRGPTAARELRLCRALQKMKRGLASFCRHETSKLAKLVLLAKSRCNSFHGRDRPRARLQSAHNQAIRDD